MNHEMSDNFYLKQPTNQPIRKQLEKSRVKLRNAHLCALPPPVTEFFISK